MPKTAYKHRRAIANLLLYTLVVGAIFSCGVRKRSGEVATREGSSATAIRKRLEAFQLETMPNEGFRLQGTLEIKKRDGSEEWRSNLFLFAKQGEGIALTLRPIPFVEVGTLYILPEAVFLFDKIIRRYVQAHYEELSSLLGYSISYELLASLLLGYYYPSEIGTGRFGEDMTFWLKEDTPPLAIGYRFDRPIAKPSKAILQDWEKAREVLTIEYRQFQSSSVGHLPSEIHLASSYAPLSSYTLTLSFGEARLGEKQLSRRLQPPSTDRYTPITLHELLMSL